MSVHDFYLRISYSFFFIVLSNFRIFCPHYIYQIYKKKTIHFLWAELDLLNVASSIKITDMSQFYKNPIAHKKKVIFFTFWRPSQYCTCGALLAWVVLCVNKVFFLHSAYVVWDRSFLNIRRLNYFSLFYNKSNYSHSTSEMVEIVYLAELN